MSKIIVTGGAGFIGSHLVDELIKQDHQVWVVDDLSSGSEKNINKKANFIKLCITNPELEQVFIKAQPDYVFHLAAQKSVKKSVEDPAFDAKVNILGSLNVLEYSKKYGIKKIIFTSTGGAIYGDTDTIPTPEEHEERPISPYGISKLTVDKHLHYHDHVYGLPYVSLRLSNIYGPRQDPEGEAGVVAIFLKKIYKNQQPVIFGSGRQTRDYLYVGDAVNAHVMAMGDGLVGIFNIGTSKETDVNKLFDNVRKASNSPFERKHADPIPGEQMRSCLSYEKFNRVTGWAPKIDLDQGIQLTNKWFRKQYE